MRIAERGKGKGERGIAEWEMRIAEFSEGGPGGIAEFGFRIAEFSEEELRNSNSAFPRVSNSAKVPERLPKIPQSAIRIPHFP